VADQKTDQKKTDEKAKGATSTFAASDNPNVGDSVSLPLSGRKALASESSDPAVQQLMAERQSHEMNRNAASGEPDETGVKVADEKIAEIDKRLKDLGYE
jgi:hypothetical protein